MGHQFHITRKQRAGGLAGVQRRLKTEPPKTLRDAAISGASFAVAISPEETGAWKNAIFYEKRGDNAYVIGLNKDPREAFNYRGAYHFDKTYGARARTGKSTVGGKNATMKGTARFIEKKLPLYAKQLGAKISGRNP